MISYYGQAQTRIIYRKNNASTNRIRDSQKGQSNPNNIRTNQLNNTQSKSTYTNIRNPRNIYIINNKHERGGENMNRITIIQVVIQHMCINEIE